MLVKTKSGRLVELISPEEDAAITAAAMSDPDAMPLTDEEWEAVKPTLKRGRPKAEVTKVPVTIRLSSDVVAAFKATGTGWQPRMDEALQTYLREHPL